MDVRDVIGKLLNKNRTIVSLDAEECMEVLSELIPLRVHRYPSGTEHETWIVPEEWNVVKAELRDGDRVLASYEDSPLFLAPYSCSFTGWVSREELLTHVRSNPASPDTYCYEVQLAYNCHRRLKEWIITLPESLRARLDAERYFVDIQVETKPGEMLVAESVLPGEQRTRFAFLSHLCHPGQANDGLAGVLVGIQVMRRIAREFPQRRYSYQLLIMPETIGSAVYLANHAAEIDDYLGAIFCEMPGARSPLNFVHTRRGDAYLDRITPIALRRAGATFAECGFLESIGNDERMFDSPGVGIPSASLVRFPFFGYHTNRDDLGQVDAARMEEIVNVLMELVRLIESDFIPRPRQRVTFYLARYGLFANPFVEPDNHTLNTSILGHLWDGLSVVDIALKIQAPVERVFDYVSRLVAHGLVDEEPVPPRYWRGRRAEGTT